MVDCHGVCTEEKEKGGKGKKTYGKQKAKSPKPYHRPHDNSRGLLPVCCSPASRGFAVPRSPGLGAGAVPARRAALGAGLGAPSCPRRSDGSAVPTDGASVRVPNSVI